MRESTRRLAVAALTVGGISLAAGGSAGAATTGPVVNPVTYTAPPMTSLDNPMGITTDNNGTVFVSNTEDNVVASLNGTTTTTVAGSYDNSGESGDGGPAVAATLYQPTALARDAAGDLFIADTGDDVIREVAATTGTITDVAGNQNEGYTGDGGAATAATLDNPEGVAVDATGDLFIADTYNNVVREVTSTGTIRTVAGNGNAGYGGDGGPATAAQLSYPTGLAVDAVGDLYIADSGNNVIRRVGTDGTITTAAGNYADDLASGGLGGFSGDGGAATAAQLHSPQGVALDRAGDLYIADTFNNAIREVTPGGTISTLVNTTGKKGSLGTKTNNPAASTNLNSPYAVAADNSTGDVYIADTTNNAVRQVSGLPVPGPAAAGPAGVIGSTMPPAATPEVPWAPLLPLAGAGVGALIIVRRRARQARTA